MLKKIRLQIDPKIQFIQNSSHFKLDWEDSPPDSVEIISKATVVFANGVEEPLGKYTLAIEIFDSSDPITKEQEPFEQIFSLIHELGYVLQTWTIYKRPDSPDIWIDAQ